MTETLCSPVGMALWPGPGVNMSASTAAGWARATVQTVEEIPS